MRLFRLTTFSVLLSLTPLQAGQIPKLTNLDINTEADEVDPFVSADGATLLYASDKAGSFDIHLSKRPFKTAKALLAQKDDDERSPFVYKGVDIYFATNHIPDAKLKDLKNFDIVKKTGERAPIPLIGISQAEDELHPWITPAGKELYFSRKTKEGWVLMVARGPTPGPIGEAKEVGFAPGFCNATLNGTATVMYVQGPLDKEGADKERTGIFRSKRTSPAGKWSMPEPVEALNDETGKRGAMTPCLSGERLFFASDRAGGKGGMDIWMVLTSKLK
jgi:hypothetical protein